MKIRNGFVSNSSSCSFAVNIKSDNPFKEFKYALPGDCYDYKKNVKTLTLPSKKGKYSFGWEMDRDYSTLSKLNYLAIQILHTSPEEKSLYKKMIEDAIHQVDDTVKILWNDKSVEWNSPCFFAGIDHQSLGLESLPHVLDSVESIKNFIFNEETYIQGGNDNGGNDSQDYYESRARVYGNLYLIHDILDKEPYDWDNDYEKGEEDKRFPIIEGTCKDCGSDVIFQFKWSKEDGSPIRDFNELMEYYSFKKEDSLKFGQGFGYYRCTNPNCKNHERTFVWEGECDSYHLPYIEWNEKVLGIKLTDKKI